MTSQETNEEQTYEQRFNDFLESGVRRQRLHSETNQAQREQREKSRKLAGKRKARVLQNEDTTQFANHVIRYLESFRMGLKSPELSDTFTNNFQAFLQAALAGKRSAALHLARQLQEEGEYADAEKFLTLVTEFIWASGTPDSQIPNEAEAGRWMTMNRLMILSGSIMVLVSILLIAKSKKGDFSARDKRGASDEMRQSAGESELKTQELPASRTYEIEE